MFAQDEHGLFSFRIKWAVHSVRWSSIVEIFDWSDYRTTGNKERQSYTQKRPERGTTRTRNKRSPRERERPERERLKLNWVWAQQLCATTRNEARHFSLGTRTTGTRSYRVRGRSAEAWLALTQQNFTLFSSSTFDFQFRCFQLPVYEKQPTSGLCFEPKIEKLTLQKLR